MEGVRRRRILIILRELERRRQNRELTRQLRDTNDPFNIPEVNFRRNYRLPREIARDLYSQMLPHFIRSRRNTSIPNVVKFVSALHFFAHGSYQKSVGRDRSASMSQSSVSRSVHEVCDILVQNFVNRYIRFPTDLPDIIAVKAGFYDKFGFSGVIGCIDGTHIKIFPPNVNDPNMPGNIFINRKGFHSLNCQIICDSNLKILALNARFPGSVHDAAIWTLSNIRHWAVNNFHNGDRNSWLLGDSGYPLEPFLLTPIPGADRETPEGRYTAAHILTRNSVERCIGLWKAYFRCLLGDRVLHYSPQFASKIIYSCAILHNILRNHGILDNDIEMELEADNEPDMPENNNLHAEGLRTRNNIIQRYFLECFYNYIFLCVSRS